MPALWVTLAGMVLMGAAGGGLYLNEIREAHEEQASQLADLVDIKLNEIAAWRRERVGDALYASSGPFLARAMRTLASQPDVEDAPELRAAVETRLRALIDAYAYRNVFLVTTAGAPVAAVGAPPHQLFAAETALVDEALGQGKPVFSDFFLMDEAGRTGISVAVPVDPEDGPPVAVLVLRRDPSLDLFPLLDRPSTGSETVETDLVRREGEFVAFFGRLRNAGDLSFMRRVPIVDPYDISVQATAHGRRGLLTGRDYRGREVLAQVRDVPDFPWVMMTKIDEEELRAETHHNLRAILLIPALGGLLAMVGAFAMFNAREQRHYRTLYGLERERRESEQETRATLYSIGDAVITTDQQGGVRRMNPVAERLSGWTEAEARGRPLQEVFRIHNETTGAVVENPVTRVLATSGIVGLANHTMLVARDGSSRPIADSAAPIRVGDGSITGVVMVFRDQSDERRLQKRLEDDALRLRILFDRARDGIVVLVDGKIVQANQAYADLLGRPLQETLRLGVWDWDVGLDTPQKYYAAYPEVVPVPLQFETCFRRADGTLLDVEISHTPVDWNGQRAAFCVCRDISVRRRIEDALRQSEQQFRDFAEFVPQLTWMAGPDGMDTYHNRRWTDYTGLAVEESLGLDYLKAVHPEDVPRMQEAWRRGTEQGGPYEIEFRLRRRDGVYRWFLGRGMAIRDAQGSVVRWLGYSTDIEDIKQAEAQLERNLAERTRDLIAARDSAEAASRVKDVFLATMSHELRTPLNSIIGFSDLMLNGLAGDLTPSQRRQIEIVHKSGQHLLGLISDVLDISKIETGQLVLDVEPIALRELLEEERSAFDIQATERGLALQLQLPPPEVKVLADSRRLRQVIGNLLSNAIKYTDRGVVTLSVDAGDGRARFTVADTGIGIPAEELPLLFQPFHRVAGPKGRLREGTGLGLAIARRMATAMGGEIGVDSEPGRGSRFWFTVPLA